ncbi:MAG: SDR family NAD(P)-dependent oxidoreductase [Alphaproteobacteria bacterium]
MALNNSFTNKNVLILGANSDVGICLIKSLYNYECNLFLASRNIENLKKITTNDNFNLDKINFIHLDVLSEASISSLFESNIEIPDIIISCIGYLNDKNSNLSKILQTNFEGPVTIINKYVERFALRGYGTIVGVSSIAGERGRAKNYLYSSAKSGFTSYLSGLRSKYNHKNINVITVIPGFIDTKMTRDLNLNKLITSSPELVADKILKAIIKGKKIEYISFFWLFVSVILKNLPDFIIRNIKF